MGQIVIFRQGSLGDTAAAIPTLKLIRDRHRHDRKILLTARRLSSAVMNTEDLIEGMGIIDEVIWYPEGMRNFLALAVLAKKLRSYSFYRCYYLMPRRNLFDLWCDLVFLRLAGVGPIIGAPRKRSDLFPKRIGEIHEKESLRILRLIDESKQVVTLNDLDLELRPEEYKRIDSFILESGIKQFIALSLFSKMSTKNWPEERWVSSLKSISISTKHRFVLIGSQQDSKISEELCDAAGVDCVNACGLFSARETAALLARATLFLGVDSGPMHLAAASGVPSVVLFSARDLPGKWYPYGTDNVILQGEAPCHGCMLEDGCPNDNLCMKSITDDSLVTAVLNLL